MATQIETDKNKIAPTNSGQEAPVQSPEQENGQSATNAETPGNLFYNVMPKAAVKGTMIDAKLKTQAPQIEIQTEPDPDGLMSKIKKFRVTIIIISVLLVLGVVGYFVITKYAGSGYESVDIIAKNPPVPASGQKATSTQPGAGITAGFTSPKTWRDKYFPNCADIKTCGDSADPDHDGLANLQENALNTDPNNPDSDQDGISDGDEVNVFGSKPMDSRTSKDPKYNDADYIKGGYDFATQKLLTAAQIENIIAKIKQYSLHQTTIVTLGNIANKLYKMNLQNATSTPGNAAETATSTLDQSLPAQQDRDTKRLSTIKNIESALVKYSADNKTYPLSSDFAAMFSDIKPYLKVATNPVDPINQAPYIYSYTPNSNGTDFSLSFYSEIAKQAIVKTSADAKKDAAAEQADIYDNQRQTDLDSLRTALLLYSQKNVAGSQDYVFPPKDKYKTALVPQFISAIPKDPSTAQDYDYQVASTFDSFTLKATLQNPPAGTTGYICNQIDDCHNY